MEFKIAFVHFTEQSHHNKVDIKKDQHKKYRFIFRIGLMASSLGTRMHFPLIWRDMMLTRKTTMM
jgi:hypothetical protein